MPRSGGVYSLPAGNPVVTLTTISSTWANTTMSDIANALTGSLPTDGSAPMSGALRLSDGTVGSPGLTWATETTSGWYRIGANQFGFSLAGNAALTVNANRQWNIPAPITGNALTVNGVAGNAPILALGGGASDNAIIIGGGSAGFIGSIVFQGNAANAGQVSAIGTGGQIVGSTVAGDFVIRQISTGTFRIITNNADRLDINSAGNATLNAPSSGVALSIIYDSTAIATQMQTSAGLGYIKFGDQTGTRHFEILTIGSTGGSFYGGSAGDSVINASVGGGNLILSTNDLARLKIAQTGAVTINTPTSGTSLTIGTLASGFAVSCSDGTNTNSGIGFAGTHELQVGVFGSFGLQLISGNRICISLNSAGNVTVNAPSSGAALAVQGVAASAYTATFAGGTGFACAVGLIDGNAGTRNWQLRVGQLGTGIFDIFDNTAAASRFQITTTGACVIGPANAAATTLSISGNGVGDVALNITQGSAVVTQGAANNSTTVSITGCTGTASSGGNGVLVLKQGVGSSTLLVLSANGLGLGSAVIYLANVTTTGGQTPTLGANKPGAVSGAPQAWLPVSVAGTNGWIPIWA